MNAENIKEQIYRQKIVAIVRGVYGGDCVKLAEALYDGGIRLLEVAFVPGNEDAQKKTQEAISYLARTMDGRMSIGAGTVADIGLLNMARDAGASFIIAPNTVPDVIRAAKKNGLVSIPGAMTPSEIFTAYECGADLVKVFPAGNLGAGYIKAVRGPFPHIPLVAVGGVDENNMTDFLKAGAVGLGIGGKLVNKEWVRSGEFDKITALARSMCEKAQTANS